MSTSSASTNTTVGSAKKMASEKSVHFSEQAVREAERAEAAREVAALAKQKPHNFCVKKGKWYDCLRPVPGYMGGGIVDFDAEYKKKNVGVPAMKKSGKA
jgi:hypothetical protein